MLPDWVNWLNVALNLIQFAIVILVGRAMWRRLRAADAAVAQAAAVNWEASRVDRVDLRTQLAGVQGKIGMLQDDQMDLRREMVHQKETLNRIIVRLDRMPTHRDLEIGLMGLQGNIALILAGRPPAPITITQHGSDVATGNTGPLQSRIGAQFNGAVDIRGGVAGQDIGHIHQPGALDKEDDPT